MAAIARDLPRRAAAISLLLLLAAAPGAAQRRMAMNIARPYLDDEIPTARGTMSVPGNVEIPENLRSTITAMLRYSPTFRRQCARIGRAADLEVVVQRGLLAASAKEGAVTRMVRGTKGGIEADVLIDALGDTVLLIAHEFEHIIEQLDGVDLAAMAARSATGVSARSDDGQYETERAVAAGQRVAQEVRDGQRREP
jgi:hypothetical protein